MKTSTMILFGCAIILAFFWQKEYKKNSLIEKECASLKSQIADRDSVNEANKILIEKFKEFKNNNKNQNK